MRPAGWTGFTLSKIKAKRDLTEAQLQPELWRDHPRSISHLFPTKSMFWLKSWKSFITAPKGIRPQHLVGSLDSSQEGNTALSLKMFLMIYPTNGLKYSQYWESLPANAPHDLLKKWAQIFWILREPTWKCPSWFTQEMCSNIVTIQSLIQGWLWPRWGLWSQEKTSTKFHPSSTHTVQGFHTLLQVFVFSTD